MWHEAIPSLRTTAILSMHLTVLVTSLWAVLTVCRGNHWKKYAKVSVAAILLITADVYATGYYGVLTRTGWNLETKLGTGVMIAKTIFLIAAATYLVIRHMRSRKTVQQRTQH